MFFNKRKSCLLLQLLVPDWWVCLGWWHKHPWWKPSGAMTYRNTTVLQRAISAPWSTFGTNSVIKQLVSKTKRFRNKDQASLWSSPSGSHCYLYVKVWLVQMNPQRLITRLCSSPHLYRASFRSLFWFPSLQLGCFGSVPPLSPAHFGSQQLLSLAYYKDWEQWETARLALSKVLKVSLPAPLKLIK